MKEKIIGFLKVFFPFVVLLFVLQLAVVTYGLDVELYYSTWAIYSFHFLATFLIFVFVVFVHQNFEEKTGFAFMGTSFLKMLAAILFLLPMLLSDNPSKLADVVAFFLPYFLFLIFETYFVVKLINPK